MKEKFSELGELIWISTIAILVVAVVVGVTMTVDQVVYPWWLSVQRQAVEQSKSFTDSNNNMLATYMLEYGRLDTKIAEAQGDENLVQTYRAQQSAILGRMCTEISTMKINTVNPSTLSFISSKGGCK